VTDLTHGRPLVEGLRLLADDGNPSPILYDYLTAAADEIERLRELLREGIADDLHNHYYPYEDAPDFCHSCGPFEAYEAEDGEMAIRGRSDLWERA
jgi:hypothetical protein